jgi:hypothetical protein
VARVDRGKQHRGVAAVNKHDGKLTAREIDGLLKILRVNVKAAKASISSRASDLKAAYEIQLNTLYPPSGDPLWNAEYQAALAEWKPRAARIEARAIELGIGTRFRPRLIPPSWAYGGEQLFKDLRVERRRIAHAQIDAKLKGDIEEMERKSAAAQMEIISNGFVTDAAREFMQKLPSIDQFVPSLKVEELVALIEGKNQPEQSLSGQLLGFMPSQDQLTEGDK